MMESLSNTLPISFHFLAFYPIIFWRHPVEFWNDSKGCVVPLPELIHDLWKRQFKPSQVIAVSFADGRHEQRVERVVTFGYFKTAFVIPKTHLFTTTSNYTTTRNKPPSSDAAPPATAPALPAAAPC